MNGFIYKSLLLLVFILLSAPAEADSPCGGCLAEEKCADKTSRSSIKAVSDDESNKNDGGDEFMDAGEMDEFSDVGEGEFQEGEIKEEQGPILQDSLDWVIWILIFTAIAGVFVRYKPTRNFRTIFLIGSLIVLGFYRGGCPCMLSSFQNVFLAGLGVSVSWVSMLWFWGLIPLTYIFGQVWCGWACHLGALQEFIYKKNKFEFLKGVRAQKIMHGIRYGLLGALIVQLFWTKSILFVDIDPFKVAFNLSSYYLAGWILLGLLLLTSLFIYRPFCQAACPVGLFLGWISKIPGASLLGVKGKAKGCKLCSEACETNAIRYKDNKAVINNQDCYLCGDCLDACKKNEIGFFRKSKEHPQEAVCGSADTDVKPAVHQVDEYKLNRN